MRALTFLAAFVIVGSTMPALAAVTPAELLAQVKKAEAGLRDFRTDMVITQANRKTISGMGEGYSDIMKLEKAVISYKKPDKIRWDGYAVGVKVAYIQNGYTKLILASMIRHKENVKDAPGKRQDTLDLGFLSSRLWTDNTFSLVDTDKNGVVKLKLDPKFGGNDKRHDLIWVDPRTLRVLKREKYRGSGEMRIRMDYSEFTQLSNGLPIATRSTMFDRNGGLLGTVKYKDLKINPGLPDSLFSLSARK